MNPRKTSSGFTLMEVAVAGALVALLSACVFRGILTIKDHARATADRIAAQGLCMERYESMKAVAWENVDESGFPSTNILLSSLSKDPTKGRLMAEISNVIEPDILEGGVQVKNVEITCSWTFRGRPRSETLRGVIVDGYSTYAEAGALSATIDLNPNYPLPQMFYIRTVDGSVYTQLNLSELPSSLNATTVVVMAGGGGRQSVTLGSTSKSISNEKTVAFTAAALSDPIQVSVSTTTDTVMTGDDESQEVTRYALSLSCGMASFSFK